MSERLSAQEVGRRLRARGYDGLYHPDPALECGCWADDLYPCGERPKECRPGVARGNGIYPKRTPPREEQGQ